MKKIQLTQGKVAIVDDEDYEFLMRWKWCASNGYAYRTEYPSKKGIFMHRVINQTPDHLNTDHIDGNRLNNMKTNLRNVTQRQNLLNKRSDNYATSKYKGVSWSKERNKWVAQISNGKNRNLGRFNREIDAAIAYNNAAIEFHGKFAKLNIIMDS